MKRSDRLKKMSMPAKAKDAKEADDDLDFMSGMDADDDSTDSADDGASLGHDETDESPEDELDESDEDQEKEDEEGTEKPDPKLKDIDDDELLAEAKRRGLIHSDDIKGGDDDDKMDQGSAEMDGSFPIGKY